MHCYDTIFTIESNSSEVEKNLCNRFCNTLLEQLMWNARLIDELIGCYRVRACEVLFFFNIDSDSRSNWMKIIRYETPAVTPYDRMRNINYVHNANAITISPRKRCSNRNQINHTWAPVVYSSIAAKTAEAVRIQISWISFCFPKRVILLANSKYYGNHSIPWSGIMTHCSLLMLQPCHFTMSEPCDAMAATTNAQIISFERLPRHSSLHPWILINIWQWHRQCDQTAIDSNISESVRGIGLFENAIVHLTSINNNVPMFAVNNTNTMK